MKKSIGLFRDIGPGLVIAATGLGAGDMIVASVAGARYGTTLLWAAVLGAIMKYAMNEGLARWQLATGTTLLEGWVSRLPKFFSLYFFIYLLLWTFIVAAAITAGELRLHEIAAVDADVVDLKALQDANLVSRSTRTVKVFASGKIDKAVTLKGIKVTKGARAAIEAAGGKIED